MDGFEGWDDYAPFYDWENARTLGRRDVPFWRNLALNAGGPVLELGCGTGRIALPSGRAGVPARRRRSIGGDAGLRCARRIRARAAAPRSPGPGATCTGFLPSASRQATLDSRW